jgi:hypothetical protein
MGNIDCYEKDENIENIIEERNEIFNFSPEDNKIPDDASFISNQGGEYPVESDQNANFRYEAKYPKLVNSEKIIIRNLPQDRIFENEDDGHDYNQEMQFYEQKNMYDMNNLQKGQMMRLKQLFDLCYRNGKPRSCEDFNPKGYTMFYRNDDPYFYYNKDEVFPNTLKIYNQNDKNNLQIYQGDVNASGQRHGIGKCTTPYYVLIGQWKNDQFSGWGRESRSNGDVFEGRYENGLLNGKGIFMNEKKCKYVGDFRYTRRWGKGDLTTDRIHYEGDFYNNQIHGKGRIKFLRDGIEYKGDFKCDQLDGYGVFSWRNGDRYEGQVRAGKMHGYGKYKYNNGKEYKGFFNHGQKMSDKMKKYDLWRSTGYGVNANYQNQNNGQTQLEPNGENNSQRQHSNLGSFNQNQINDNMGQNSVKSNGLNQNGSEVNEMP